MKESKVNVQRNSEWGWNTKIMLNLYGTENHTGVCKQIILPCHSSSQWSNCSIIRVQRESLPLASLEQTFHPLWIIPRYCAVMIPLLVANHSWSKIGKLCPGKHGNVIFSGLEKDFFFFCEIFGDCDDALIFFPQHLVTFLIWSWEGLQIFSFTKTQFLSNQISVILI